MSTPLSVLVGGGHARYLIAAADKAQAWLRSPAYRARSQALRVFGYTPAQLMVLAITDATEIRTEEDISEIVRILDERGVVP